MTYKEKKIILGVTSLSTEVHVSWLVKELEKAWAALEWYEKSGKPHSVYLVDAKSREFLDDFSNYGKRAREALNG